METIRYPNGNVLLRNLKRDYPIISHGEGLYLFDESGKRYTDASGGALVTSVGHGNKHVVARISEQLAKVAYVNGTQFTSSVTEDLATRLASYGSTLGLTHACFLSSGSEAVEAAVKFARQIWMENGEPQRTKVIARTPGYHGNTLFALSLSGRPHYKKYYGPLLHDIIQIEAPYEYRATVANYAKDGARYYAAQLEQAIEEARPETVAAFIFEPIIGSSAGGSLPPPGYFSEIQKVCRKHGILMIADEVLCGSGRTGRFFASEHFDLQPDILLLGKGLNGGYAPLSAMLVREGAVKQIADNTGYFMHAQTYMQAPCMTVAGLAVLEEFEKYQLIENSAVMGELFHLRLHEELDVLPNVGFVTGRGLLAGVEFVEDKSTKHPFDRARKIAENFTSHAFANGLIFWPHVGQADGVNGDLIVMGPTLNITSSQVEDIVQSLKSNIQSFFGRL